MRHLRTSTGHTSFFDPQAGAFQESRGMPGSLIKVLRMSPPSECLGNGGGGGAGTCVPGAAGGGGSQRPSGGGILSDNFRGLADLVGLELDEMSSRPSLMGDRASFEHSFLHGSSAALGSSGRSGLGGSTSEPPRASSLL
mmetsp:Transcript_29506/g.66841  ORF Transcript_29506/g.66841 Transcript_29506/m.66841 type:complete len:140 (+) Transcript_29506:179-598(+)